MAWEEGFVKIPGNFHNGTPTPLDGKTVVEVPADLASITAPFKGLVVHVADNDAKTYVCIDEANLGNSIANGDVNPLVWKELGAGGGSSTTVTLEDESSAPTGAADKVILYSADETSAESMPDHLYLFNEIPSEDDAIDSGRDGAGNTGLKESTSDVDYTGGEYIGGYGNSAIFASGNTPSIRVGGTAAPYWMSGNSTDVFLQGQGATARGDFEIQFLFSILNGSLDRTHTLLSVDPSNHQTDVEGFYSVLLVASSSSGGSSIAFEYFDDTTDKLETVEWTIPGSLVTESTGRYHLAISFFENDRGVDTTDINPSVGKFRCYLDGVVLEDKNSAGALSVAGQFEKLGKASSSPYTLHPLYLGQYLNGDAAAGGPAALYRFNDNFNNEVSGGPSITATGTQFLTHNGSQPASWGKQVAILNTSRVNTQHWLEVPNSFAGTGAFTFECFIDIGGMASGGSWYSQTIFSANPTGGGNAGRIEVSVSDATLFVRIYTSSGSIDMSWNCDAVSPVQFPFPSCNGTMRHFALQRSESVGGGNVDWTLYFDGQYRAGNNHLNRPYENIGGTTMRVGRDYGSYGFGLQSAFIDDLRFTNSAVYSGTGSYPVPTQPTEIPLDPSTRFFEGKMHEFAVWNHRCLHNTSDKFARPTTPTRSTPLSVASVVDSENTSSPILTTSNLGMLLPKAVEGLADGTAWNDKGVVKIAPLTGDLDAPETADINSGVLSLSAGTTPSATAGVAKIYAKNFVVGGLGDALFHFDGNLDEENGGPDAVFEISNHPAATTTGTATYTSSPTSGFGSEINIVNAYEYVYYGVTNNVDSQYIKLGKPGIGTEAFTVEFFVTMSSTTRFQALISNAADLDQTVYSSYTTSFGNFCLSLDRADAGGDTLELWVQPASGSREGVEFSPTSSARASTNAPVHVALARTISGADSLWHCWVDGTYMDAPGGRTTTGVGDLNFKDWYLGKGFKDSQGTWSHIQMKTGKFDEVRVTKGDPSYTVGSNLTVPTAPFTASSPVTVARLFCMDSLGNETQLTP
tara:strand:+ start:9184 stop:12270 length:3087 start_codon:yes stop_codon:yes gene_type:complete